MSTNWKQQFDETLPLLGHRNWILLVDSAYPLQGSATITTIDTGLPMAEAVAEVVAKIEKAPHVRPVYYQDAELDVLDDSLCAGTDALKAELKEVFGDLPVQSIMHDDVFSKLDKASQLFSVLVLKTDCTIPYTSLFIELDCGYWDVASEAELRSRLK